MDDVELEDMKKALDQVIIDTVSSIPDETGIHPVSVWTATMSRAMGVLHKVSPEGTMQIIGCALAHMKGEITLEELSERNVAAFKVVADAWMEWETNGRTIQ
ncbi:hypothetical protein GCM10011360_17890 [Primorskyibacter flagellatus]|uniref:Uncharacterized protein n=1 Tax=Primorskyibacter flagellatus TaxID=1387277 RepID=A0A917EES1_9RHOB|nr:hypothetical protein [Primorskyibacter flagellatus]GGE30291.1 hypothetical protein GCM10011360_17890 [Primorskyibacter flagellatus]